MATNVSTVAQGADSLLHGEFHTRRRALAAPSLTPVRVMDASELTTSVVTSPVSRRQHVITDAAVASDTDAAYATHALVSAGADARFDPDPWLAEVAKIATAEPSAVIEVGPRRDQRHDPNLSTSSLGSNIAHVARQAPRSDSPFALGVGGYGTRPHGGPREWRDPRAARPPAQIGVSAVATPVGMSPIAKPPPNRRMPVGRGGGSDCDSPFDSDAGSPHTSVVVAEGGDNFVVQTRGGSTQQVANFVPRTADSPRRRPPPPPPRPATDDAARVREAAFTLNSALRIPFENAWAASRNRLLSACGAAMNTFLAAAFAATRKVEMADEERADRLTLEHREDQVREALRVTLDAIVLAWDRLGRPRAAPPNFVSAEIRDAFSAGEIPAAGASVAHQTSAATARDDDAWAEGLRADDRATSAALAKSEGTPVPPKSAASATSLATGAEGPVRLLRRRPPAKRSGKAKPLAATSITQLAVTSSSPRAPSRAPPAVPAPASAPAAGGHDHDAVVVGADAAPPSHSDDHDDAAVGSREVSPSRLRGTAIGGSPASPTEGDRGGELSIPPPGPTTGDEQEHEAAPSEPPAVAVADPPIEFAAAAVAVEPGNVEPAGEDEADVQPGAVSDSSSTLTLTTESPDATDDDMSETLPGA